jgi:hypothetical protein
MRTLVALAVSAAALALPQAALAQTCPAPGSVRLMLHEPEVLAARLARLGQAPDSPDGRAGAVRLLFEAAGCPQVAEGSGERRNVECLVPGESRDVIVVGTSQSWDSLGSLALLPSLAESLMAASRRHSFRFVAFSPHEGISERVNRVQKPKGAQRLLDELSPDERARVGAMVHVGPLGFGLVSSHPDRADSRLACAFADAAKAAKLEVAPASAPGEECVQSGSGPLSASRSYVGCRPGTDWTGGKEWEPFLRRRIAVFGIHSTPGAKLAGQLDSALYLKSYRLLAIFLALADDALAAPASAGGAASSR